MLILRWCGAGIFEILLAHSSGVNARQATQNPQMDDSRRCPNRIKGRRRPSARDVADVSPPQPNARTPSVGMES